MFKCAAVKCIMPIKPPCIVQRLMGHTVTHFCRAMLCISAAYSVMRCLSVCPSARHVHVFCVNDQTYPQTFFTVGYTVG